MVKEKENPTSQAILQFLMTNNRPYSANDLVGSTALKEHGKAAIQKCLDQLVIADSVKEKVYNKQKIYVINQDLVTSSNQLSVVEMDDKIFKLSKEIAEDEDAVKKAEAELKSLTSSMTCAEASSELEMILKENEKMEKKLEELAQNKVKVSATDFKKVQQLKEKSVTELRKRKRICLEMVDQIMESYPNSKKALMEEIGIEAD